MMCTTVEFRRGGRWSLVAVLVMGNSARQYVRGTSIRHAATVEWTCQCQPPHWRCCSGSQVAKPGCEASTQYGVLCVGLASRSTVLSGVRVSPDVLPDSRFLTPYSSASLRRSPR